MKVIHLLDSLARGGIQTLALDLCRNARAGGMDLTLVATGGGEMEDEFKSASGAEFIRLQRKLPVDPSLINQLRKIINEREIQIIHSHQAVEAMHAHFATAGTRARKVLSFHGWLPSAKNRVAIKFLIPRMNANVAVSHVFLERFRDEEGFETKDFRVIYNGVDSRRLETKEKIRAEFGLDERHLLFGMIGNFYFGVKDQMTVCRALPEVFAAVPEARFIFVGARSRKEPHFYDDCVNFCRQQGIAERVIFTGARSDIPAILNSLDAFVFSSLQEGSPIAVMEALMKGLPTIVSDIPALAEVTGEGVCALQFSVGNSAQLAQEMIRLAKRKDLRAQLSESAERRAREHFSIETHIKNLLGLYNELAGRDMM